MNGKDELKMVINAYKLDENGTIISGIEIEYDARDKEERMEASMKLMPFMPPMLQLGCCTGREKEKSDSASTPTADMAKMLMDMMQVFGGKK